MEPHIHNVIRSVAKLANEEIKIRRKAEPGTRVEVICTEVMAKHWKKVSALGVSRFWLSIEIGRLNGRLTER